MIMGEKKLTPKQQRFVEEYLVDLNASQAALRARYSERTAARIGQENLQKPVISLAIQERLREISGKVELTQERVLREVASISFSDIRQVFDGAGTLIRPDQLPDVVAGAVASIEVIEREGETVYKYRLWNKGQALELAMKYLGILEKKIDAGNSESLAQECDRLEVME